jgi:ABC-type transporter Mla subunit MlaD
MSSEKIESKSEGKSEDKASESVAAQLEELRKTIAEQGEKINHLQQEQAATRQSFQNVFHSLKKTHKTLFTPLDNFYETAGPKLSGIFTCVAA